MSTCGTPSALRLENADGIAPGVQQVKAAAIRTHVDRDAQALGLLLHERHDPEEFAARGETLDAQGRPGFRDENIAIRQHPHVLWFAASAEVFRLHLAALAEL